MKKILTKLFILLLFVFLSCKQTLGNPVDTDVKNIINIVWQGSFNNPPTNPQVGWAYYDTTKKISFVWDGKQWQMIAQDGKSIVWKGDLTKAPSNPEENWAYYNIIDGNSYIYNGIKWEYLAKAGRDGASGIMLWLGTLESAPSNPKTGYCYYNLVDKCSYIWDGNSWEIIAKDGTNGNDGTSIIWKGVYTIEPSNPKINWAYYNTITNTAYIWNGSKWDILTQSLGGDTTVQVPISWKGTYNSAPVSPIIGDAYYNSTNKASYIFDGSVWQQFSKDGEDGTLVYEGTGYLITWKGTLSSHPSSPLKGWAYYNSEDGKSFIWDGSSWQIMAQDGIIGNNLGSTSSNYSYLAVWCYTNEGQYVFSNSPSEEEVDFGKVGINNVSKTTTFQFLLQTNEKTSLKLVGSPAIQISGEDADCFSIIQPSITEVEKGKYITGAEIIFKPTSIGTKTATITIPNNSTMNPELSFIIKGTGANWPKCFDGGEGDGKDSINKILTDSEGNVYLIGYGWELANDHSGFDWWIKKLDSSGIELWSKIFDFFDDYSYSPTKDNPIYAILDNTGNLVISSINNTVKLNSSGEKLWELSLGGNLLCDSENNIIIGNSKYSSNGEYLWTNNYMSDPKLDKYNNLFYLSGNIINKIKSDGSIDWEHCTIDESGRYNANIHLYEKQLVTYDVIEGNNYLLTWDDSNGTAVDDKSAYLFVSAKNENDEIILSKTTHGYGNNAKQINTLFSGKLLVTTEPISNYSEQYAGTYSIAMYETYITGENLLSEDWVNSSLAVNGTENFTMDVIQGHPYIICLNDSSYGNGKKTARIEFSANYSQGESIYTNKNSNYSSPNIFFAKETGKVIITVKTYGSSSSYAGSYGIVFKELPIVIPQKGKAIETGISNVSSFCFDVNNNLYVTGYEENSATLYSKKDIVVKKFSPDGTEIELGWDKLIDFGHCDNEQPDKIIYENSDIIILGTGYDSISGSSGNDGLVYIYDIFGNLRNSFILPSSTGIYIGRDSLGNLIFTDSRSILKYSPSGILKWKKDTGISDLTLAFDSFENIYVAGNGTNLCSSTSNEDWIIKKYTANGDDF